jgi:hypothetical protein
MRGYSLIECICALGVVALITSGVVQLVHRSAAILGETSSLLQERLAITKSAVVLSAALVADERSHLTGLVATTNGSNPRTPSGKAHPASGVSGNSRPRSDSDVLTTIEISPRHRGRIIRSSFTADAISVDVCGAFDIPAPNEFRSHLVAGLHGLCQLTGSLQRTTNGCFNLSGRIVSGIISDNCPNNSLLEYLPIMRETSIYIDRTGELRLISHVGQRVLENQPIVRGLRALRIYALNPLRNSTIYRIEIYSNTTRSHSFLIPSGLTREPIWNEILL